MATENKEMRSVMRIEDIHLMERFAFWLERIAILTQVFCLRLPGPQLLVFSCPKYLLFSTALLLIVTNSIFLALTIERQFIRQFFFEPEAMFYIERPAIMLLVLHYVVPGGYIYCAIIGLIVLVLTNYIMINRYFNTGKSLSSETSINAKETSKDGKLNTGKSLSSETSINAKETSKDGKLNKEETGVADEDLKEKSGAETMARNVVSSIKWFKDSISAASFYFVEGVVKFKDAMSAVSLLIAKDIEKFKEGFNSALDESHELPGNSENISACDQDSKTEKDVEEEEQRITHVEDHLKEEDKDACFEVEKREDDEVGEKNSKNIMEADQVAMANQVIKEAEADNRSWDLNLSDENESVDEKAEDDDSSWEETDEFDEETEDEEASTVDDDDDDDSSWEETNHEENEETEDEESFAATGNNKSDSGSSSWEEVQSTISGGGDQKQRKADELEETEHNKEISSSSEQEKKDMTEKLEVAAKTWLQYNKDFSVLSECWNATVDLGSMSFELERMEWHKEKKDLQTRLESAYDYLEEERQNWEDRNKILSENLDVALEAIQSYKAIEEGFEKERRKWNDEKIALNFSISNADENVQYCQTLVNTYNSWYLDSLNGFIAERNELSSKLAAATSSAESFEAWYQSSINGLMDERDELSSDLKAATSSAESYKAKHSQSEEHCQYYKACFEEYEEKCHKLKEENLNLMSKLNTETSFAERYKRFVDELEDKCRKLEEEKTDLTAKLCAAKALSELYRACMHDLGS